MKDTFYKHPMPFIKLQDPKTLKMEGTAVGMYALPANMQVLSVSHGYGLFQIIDEKKGMYILVSSDGNTTWAIKKTKVQVYS